MQEQENEHQYHSSSESKSSRGSPRLRIIRQNSSKLSIPSPSRSASSIISFSSQSGIFSPTYAAIRFKFLNVILFRLSSSNNLNTLQISSLESLGPIRLVITPINSLRFSPSLISFPSQPQISRTSCFLTSMPNAFMMAFSSRASIYPVFLLSKILKASFSSFMVSSSCYLDFVARLLGFTFVALFIFFIVIFELPDYLNKKPIPKINCPSPKQHQQKAINNFITFPQKPSMYSQSSSQIKKKLTSQHSSHTGSKHLPSEQQQSQKIIPELHKDALLKEEIPTVMEAKKKLDNLIEDLNDKLVNHFKMKEEALLNQYKKELVEQQKKLNELKNTTNQEQIRTKMLERKAELQKQRNELIQENMFFSQKCQKYKQIYTKLVQESKDLEKEIQFLDNQIAVANEKRIGMVDQIASISNTDLQPQNLQLYTQKKSMFPQLEPATDKNDKSTLQKSQNTHSVRKIARSLHMAGQDTAKPKKSSSTKQFQRIDRGLLKKSTLERIFEQCVQQVKNKRKTKRTMPVLKGQEFTEYEKRAIMEIFLGNEEVKKKLYEIIFSDTERNFKRGLPKEMEKAKINFDEIGL